MQGWIVVPQEASQCLSHFLWCVPPLAAGVEVVEEFPKVVALEFSFDKKIIFIDKLKH